MPTVFTAFTALGVGLAASVALLAAELFWFRRKRDRARARQLLRRWGGGGPQRDITRRAANPTAIVVPWKPAQAAAKFKAKEQTAKTGLFLQRMQKLQESNQFGVKQSFVSTDHSSLTEDDSPTENSMLLEDALSINGEQTANTPAVTRLATL